MKKCKDQLTAMMGEGHEKNKADKKQQKMEVAIAPQHNKEHSGENRQIGNKADSNMQENEEPDIDKKVNKEQATRQNPNKVKRIQIWTRKKIILRDRSNRCS